MANPQDPSYSLSSAADDSLDARDNKLPPAFQYGKIESVSLAPLQRWRPADSGNGTYSPSSQIIFYFETGGAAFMNTNEVYMTFTFTPYVGTVGINIADVGQCQLDYNTDCLFFESQLQMNGALVEHLLNLDIFSNIIDTLENGNPYVVSSFNGTLPVVEGAAVNVISNPTSAIINADCAWYGQSTTLPRTGANFTTAYNIAVPVAVANGTALTAVQLAYHPKSFILGPWAKQFLPLAFLNQIMYTLTLNTALKSLKDTSFIIATNGQTANIYNWTWTMSNIRMHYTLTMVQDEVAAAVQKAYLANGLPSLIHSIRTYTWQQGIAQAANAALQSTVIPFTVSATSIDKIAFVILRNGDWTLQGASSCSNFTGGIQYAQLKVNGASIPANRIETGYHAYELYRQMAYAYGAKRYSNQNIQLNNPWLTAAAAGTYGARGAYISAVQNALNGAGGISAVNPSLGITGNTSSDDFNAITAPPVIQTATYGEQGCTILLFSMSDVAAMAGQNIKGGVAIRGMNVNLEMTYINGNQAVNVHMFAIQDALLIMKGTSVTTLT